MTYQTASVDRKVAGSTAVVDIWIGDSLMLGEQAPVAEVLDPSIPATFSGSKVWGRILDKTNRYTSASTHTWDALPKSYEAASSSTQITYPAVGSAKAYADGVPRLEVTPEAVDDYHRVFTLGISSSAANDDTATVALALAHWSPLVASGAMDLLKDDYITKGMIALQNEGLKARLGAVYVCLNNDANNAYSEAVANSFPMHMLQIIRDLEKHLEVYGIPVVFIGPPHVDETSAYTRLDGLISDIISLTQTRPNTMFLNGRSFITADDKVHFDAQSTIDAGYLATALRYQRSQAGLYPITKTFS